MGDKIVFVIGLFVILIAVGSTSLVSAAPPNPDGDGDGEEEGVVHEIIDLLNHPIFGLEEIKNEVRTIEETVLDSEFGLKAIKDIVKHIEDAIFDTDFGLEAIDDEVELIQSGVGNIETDIDAIQLELTAIKTETDKIQMVKDDVGLVKTETDKIQMVKEDAESIERLLTDQDIGLGISSLARSQIMQETDKIQMMKDDIASMKNDITEIKNIVKLSGNRLQFHEVLIPLNENNVFGFELVCENPAIMDCGPAILTSLSLDPSVEFDDLDVLGAMSVDGSNGNIWNAFISEDISAGIFFTLGASLSGPLTIGLGEDDMLIRSGLGSVEGSIILFAITDVGISKNFTGEARLTVYAPIGATVKRIAASG